MERTSSRPPYVAEEINPVPWQFRRRLLSSTVENQAPFLLHAAGTCRMGVRADAVVLIRSSRVYGVDRLRVNRRLIMRNDMSRKHKRSDDR